MVSILRTMVATTLIILLISGCVQGSTNDSRRWSRICIDRLSWRIDDNVSSSVVSQLLNDYTRNPYLDQRYMLEFQYVLVRANPESKLYIFRVIGVSDVEIAYKLDRLDGIAGRHVVSPYIVGDNMSSCL